MNERRAPRCYNCKGKRKKKLYRGGHNDERPLERRKASTRSSQVPKGKKW